MNPVDGHIEINFTNEVEAKINDNAKKTNRPGLLNQIENLLEMRLMAFGSDDELKNPDIHAKYDVNLYSPNSFNQIMAQVVLYVLATRNVMHGDRKSYLPTKVRVVEITFFR